MGCGGVYPFAAAGQGRGTIDFAAMFRGIEPAGFRGHYANAFGSPDDMPKGREPVAKIAAAA